MPDRRRFLQATLAATAVPGALSLSGCEALIDIFGNACPEDPAESGGIDWTPGVLHPVFYGARIYTAAEGVPGPGPVGVLYPSHQTFTDDGDNRAILKTCLDRWPVVLFLHGQPPQCLAGPDYFRRWRRIPIMLAKSGYVVVVPSYTASLPEVDAPNIAYALSLIDWVRTDWEHARWVDKRGSAIAVAGHSYGALLAARVAQARPEIGAYVGLSGPWEEFNDPRSLLQSLVMPSCFMWSNSDLVRFEDLDPHALWDEVPGTRYAVVHAGAHFDYLARDAACPDLERGPCPLIETAATELTALFLARHLPQARSSSQIPIDLVPPAVTLTPKQQFYGGADFSGLEQMKSDDRCADVELRWVEGAESGSRTLGP